MATVTPPYSFQATAGGFLGQLFDYLPTPFNPNPKPQTVLTFIPIPTSTPKYAYLSIQNNMLYLHSQPLQTPSYTPEVALDLSQYNFTTLAHALTAGGYGYTVYASTQTDGNQSVLLLGFTNFTLNGSDTVLVQVATARIWKFLYPIAQALYVASLSAGDGLSALEMPFTSGFWLDFWGDWFNIPRQPNMSDMQYVAYLLWNLRVPKVNNMAIEDILTTQYQVPVNVSDTGSSQFTVYFYPTLIGQTADASTFVSKAKAAGVSFLISYMASFTENYKTYLYNRYGWNDLSHVDTMQPFGYTATLSEPKYGFMGNSFQLGGTSGNAQLNISAFGAGSTVKDSYTDQMGTAPLAPMVSATYDSTNNRVAVSWTNYVQNLVLNSDFETVTGTKTVFSDGLTSGAAWGGDASSYTFGAGGATSNAGGQVIMTAGNSAWKPLTGSNGQVLSLTAQATFKTPATVPQNFRVVLQQDASNLYYATWQGDNNFVLYKIAGGTQTALTASGALTGTSAQAASSSYTITLSLTVSGGLTATLYTGVGTTGTVLATLTVTDISVAGGFLLGVGGDTGVVISGAQVSAPIADGWSISGDSRVAWALTQSAINGTYSMSAVGLAATQGLLYQDISLTANQPYTFSGYMSSTNMDTSGSAMELQYASSYPQTTKVTGTTSSQRYSATTTPTANATGVMNLVMNGAGMTSFDSIQVEAGATATAYARNDSTTSTMPLATSNDVYRRANGATIWQLLAEKVSTPYYDATCPAGTFDYGVDASSSAGILSLPTSTTVKHP